MRPEPPDLGNTAGFLGLLLLTVVFGFGVVIYAELSLKDQVSNTKEQQCLSTKH